MHSGLALLGISKRFKRPARPAARFGAVDEDEIVEREAVIEEFRIRLVCVLQRQACNNGRTERTLIECYGSIAAAAFDLQLQRMTVAAEVDARAQPQAGDSGDGA